jgi:hypothetical protein
MRIAAWNIGNQAGNKRFKRKVVDAILHLESNIVVLSEYCPGQQHEEIVAALREGGLRYSAHAIAEKANGILIASQFELRTLDLHPPTLDQYSPTAAVAVEPKVAGQFGPCIVGLRVPYWQGKELGLCVKYWDWLEKTAEVLKAKGPTVIIGDLNVMLDSRVSRGGDHFRRLLNAGWLRAQPEGASLAGYPVGHQIDHALLTDGCVIHRALLTHEVGPFCLSEGTDPLSDHAALVVDFEYPGEPDDNYLYELVDQVASSPEEVEDARESMRRIGLTEKEIKTIT